MSDLTIGNANHDSAVKQSAVAASSDEGDPNIRKAYGNFKYPPLSHEPILPGEYGHGRLKSRLVFEADPCPPEYRNANVSGYYRVSAAEKFDKWRQNGPISKLDDEDIRKNERLVYLLEHEPCGPTGEPSRWGDKLLYTAKWVKSLMPDSFIIIRTVIPANDSVPSGQYIDYLNSLRKLVTEFPYHFSVQLEDESILNTPVTPFYPTTADKKYNAEIQRKEITFNQVFAHHGAYQGEEDLWKAAEAEEEASRVQRQEELGVRSLPIDHGYIRQLKMEKFLQWKEDAIAELPKLLQLHCKKITEAFTFAQKLVQDLQSFHLKGFMPLLGRLPPFVSMKLKRKLKTVELDDHTDSATTELSKTEAKNIVSILPWISEERATKHIEIVYKTKAKVTEEYGLFKEGEWAPLEIPETMTEPTAGNQILPEVIED
jgi:hypothetical protein